MRTSSAKFPTLSNEGGLSAYLDQSKKFQDTKNNRGTKRRNRSPTGVHLRKERRRGSKGNVHQGTHGDIIPTRRSLRIREISSLNPVDYKETCRRKVSSLCSW